MFVLLGSLSAAPAASLEGLKGNFKKRYPSVTALKKEGKIGETSAGTLEAVRPEYMKDKRVSSIVKAENADRRKLYAVLAKQQKTTPQVVAGLNAQRNFGKAAKGEFLKKGGKWKKK
jgi:uncharacterized protein YdbL (DUF1318 family)